MLFWQIAIWKFIVLPSMEILHPRVNIFSHHFSLSFLWYKCFASGLGLNNTLSECFIDSLNWPFYSFINSPSTGHVNVSETVDWFVCLQSICSTSWIFDGYKWQNLYFLNYILSSALRRKNLDSKFNYSVTLKLMNRDISEVG